MKVPGANLQEDQVVASPCQEVSRERLEGDLSGMGWKQQLCRGVNQTVLEVPSNPVFLQRLYKDQCHELLFNPASPFGQGHSGKCLFLGLEIAVLFCERVA